MSVYKHWGSSGKTRSNYDLAFSSFTKLFETCVNPVADYGSAVWALGKECHKIDQVQLRAMRFYCGVPKTAANISIQSEMNWLPGVVRRDVETIRLYNQLINMPPTCLNRKLFMDERERCPKNSWSTNVRNLCYATGYMEEWDNLRTIPEKELKNKLSSMYNEVLVKMLQQKPKLRTYVQIKKDVEAESYLKVNMNKNSRSLICQLRTGCLPIALEVGRFVGLLLEDRKCPLCDSAVETETHFLFDCTKTDVIRQNTLANYPTFLSEGNNIEKLKFLSKMPYVMGNFICKLWRERQSILSNVVK